MNIEDIRKYCLGFAQATEKLQWGDALCFKVRGKMFAVAGLDNPRLTFKCTPDVFAELIERDGMRPSPYLARYKWVMMERLDALPDAEIKDRIQQSYEMVEAGAPKSKPRKHSKKPVRKKSSPKKR